MSHPDTGEHVTTVLDFPARDGFAVQAVRVDYDPAGFTPGTHKHPAGAYVYVVDGSVTFGIEADEPVVLTAGDTFYEPPGALHVVSRAAITRDELAWPVDRLPAIPSYELSGVAAGGMFFVVEPNREQLEELAELADAGTLRPPAVETFPLTAASEAFARSLQPGRRGKVVLVPVT